MYLSGVGVVLLLRRSLDGARYPASLPASGVVARSPASLPVSGVVARSPLVGTVPTSDVASVARLYRQGLFPEGKASFRWSRASVFVGIQENLSCVDEPSMGFQPW